MFSTECLHSSSVELEQRHYEFTSNGLQEGRDLRQQPSLRSNVLATRIPSGYFARGPRPNTTFLLPRSTDWWPSNLTRPGYQFK